MYRRLINIGINATYNLRERRTIQILNLASTLIPMLTIPIGIVNIVQGEVTNGILILSACFLFLLNLLWNKQGKFHFSKIIICYLYTLVPLVNITLTGRIPDGQYISFIPVATACLLLALLVFDRKEDRHLFNFSIFYFFSWYIFIDKILIHFSKTPPKIDYILENYAFYKMPGLAGMVAITITVSVFKSIVNRYEKENEEIKDDLASRNKELASINEKLEERVDIRTKELHASNERIIKLGFITSHKLRGPLSTILGLTELFKMDKNIEAIGHILPKLHDKSLEMDEVIKSMSKELEKEK